MTKVELAIDQWRREMPDLDLLPMEVIGRLGKATRLISRGHLDPFFQQQGLHQGEFDVLATLRRAGAPYALAPTQLFEALLISSGGMTNRLDRLEKAGLISRAPNPEDRRGTLVSLTDEGRALTDRVVPLHVENEARVLSPLSRKEQENLSALLGKLLEGLDESLS
ncbi:MarR family transcriptional regulator [Marinobacterium nitratireducens]|uniref:MarR family transcriptional regulator n=1 Tax=Marinobacterium nitratireducens TaxID=518897 RepID=A0A917ZM38_9GAMM|nr:MarR family transcriptional regulator [Marinobacterium nitratireducens]GGO84606.1 MarR family transcriptional regulator [Marinobacterium nitratireducens]